MRGSRENVINTKCIKNSSSFVQTVGATMQTRSASTVVIGWESPQFWPLQQNRRAVQLARLFMWNNSGCCYVSAIPVNAAYKYYLLYYLTPLCPCKRRLPHPATAGVNGVPYALSKTPSAVTATSNNAAVIIRTGIFTRMASYKNRQFYKRVNNKSGTEMPSPAIFFIKWFERRWCKCFSLSLRIFSAATSILNYSPPHQSTAPFVQCLSFSLRCKARGNFYFFEFTSASRFIYMDVNANAVGNSRIPDKSRPQNLLQLYHLQVISILIVKPVFFSSSQSSSVLYPQIHQRPQLLAS